MIEGLAETAWDRVFAVWRVEVDGVPVPDDDGEPRAWWSFSDAYRFAEELNRPARSGRPSWL
nr:hypothetical protein [Streptomyces sp. 846.5]